MFSPFLESKLAKNSSFYEFPKYSYQSNQYYASKIYNDHKFQRRILERPAFLIKQQSVYPESSSYSTDRALEYANNLTKPSNLKFYTEFAEQERIRTQGKNPFLGQQSDYSHLQLNHPSYFKKSSRSIRDTNPNLGVSSFRLLPQNQLIETQLKKQQQKPFETSTIKGPQMEDYISRSLLESSVNKTQKQLPIRFKNHQKDVETIKNYENQEKQISNFNQQRKKATDTTLIKLKKNPEQLVYKGKKFVKLIN